MPCKVLIVGCGFAGATIARTLAEAGVNVVMIDKRSHIGGNAFDEVHDNGERLHRYGPHLLHGKNDSEAVRFLSRFTSWIPYEHRVRALLSDGRTTPLPVNRTTLEDVFGVVLNSSAAAESFLKAKRIAFDKPTNTEEFFLANVGEELTNLFFRPYSRKMWGREPKELSPSIAARLPVRFTRDDRYFQDDFQALPSEGYTALFARMLDHPNIQVNLGVVFEHEILKRFDHSFLAIPIDVFFDCCYGALPYRSILFNHRLEAGKPRAAVLNFTDMGSNTRVTAWGILPNSGPSKTNYHLMTYETPCSMEENPGEYYYPVINHESNALLKQYNDLANSRRELTFCGRTGLFRYLDMLPAVTLHLQMAHKFLKDTARIR